MSYFCQFCDKEMRFEKSVVYEKDYITCGASACTSKASETSEAIALEASTKGVNILIFKSTNPDDPSLWRIVAKEDYPALLWEEAVLEELMDGGVVGLVPPDAKEPDWYFCARHAEQVMKQMLVDQVEAGES